MGFTICLSVFCLELALVGLAANQAAARTTIPPKPSTKYILAVVGDSLTDTGNTFRAAGVPDPNFFWRGRFTNGPSWTDYLKAAIDKKHDLQIHNYATGAATACGAPPALKAAYPFIKNMTGQSVAIAADVASGKLPMGEHVKLIPVQWIGSNDFLFPLLRAKATNTLPSAADLMAIVQSLTKCRVEGAALLASIPGVKDVVLVPISPLHTSPAVPAALKPTFRQLTVTVDQALTAAVADLQSKLDVAKAGVRVHVLGDFTWIEMGMTTTRLPYKSLDAPCFVNPVNSLDLIPKNFTAFCDYPTEHLFYDEVHPETQFHNWFATKGFLPRMRQLRLLP